MTATTIALGATASLSARLEQTAAMSRRSIVAMLRQPAMVIPSLTFPLVFLSLGTAAFSRATALPNFPKVDSFLDFALAGTIVQGVLVGSFPGATALATDIENGFFDRLLAAPTWRASILVGRLAGGMVYGGFQTLVFSVVLLPFGLTIQSGVVGVAVMAVGGMLTALAVGALMSAMALRTGSSDAVQGAFPLAFIMMFFSSTFFPRQTMDGAYRTVANINPVSHLVEGFRALVIDGLSWGAAARAIGIPIAIAVVGLLLASRELRRRLNTS